MQFTQESKSQLAKLMATENLTVEHRKVSTASFNLKDRVLTLPVWKDMSGEMYDLLTGHEVGHALETPEEGWHNAVMGTGKFDKNFKNFLNVVEDARIEKKVKRRFPGLRQSFVKAYGQLLEKDFFGIKYRNVNALPFIDRLNLYTKGGVALGIQFNNEETKMLADVESCETWEDVVRITEAIFDYSKTEQKELQQEKIRQLNSFYDDEDGDYETDMDSNDDSSNDEEENQEDGQSQDGKTEKESSDGEDTKKSESGKSDSDSEETSEEQPEESNTIERDKESHNSTSEDEDFEPVCETDEKFRENESQLLDRSCKEYLYVNLPTPIFSEILTPYKRVHELMEKFWNDRLDNCKDIQNNLLRDFKNKNDRYVSLLAKEFEMRKAASKFSRQKISETGDIDVSRIYKYQVDDNIFRKATFVPKGKSHGLVLLLDRSGSMQNNMFSSWEQILVLAMFCRKVNIPFVVYGFGNDDGTFQHDHGRFNGRSFSENVNELSGSNVFLREYLNSKMSASEFTRCTKNILALASSYDYHRIRRFSTPNSETLSNTPMTEAMIALKPLTEEFRKVNNLDIVNTVIMHDGDADRIGAVVGERTDYNGKSYLSRTGIGNDTYNLVLRDKKNKFEELMRSESDECPVRESVFNWYRKTTGSKIIGFYIAGTGNGLRAGIERRYTNEKGETLRDIYSGGSNDSYYQRKEAAKQLAQQVKAERFLESKNFGYNKFFIIPGGDDLDVENESLQVSGEVTAGKLKNAFIKMNKKKQVSRVLVNRFIGEIAV
jgi:hypothetical protein